MNETIRQIDKKLTQIGHEVIALVTECNRKTNDSARKPYLKKIDELEREYIKVSGDLDESLYVGYFICEYPAHEINTDLGEVIAINDLIKRLDSGDVSMDSTVYYVHPTKTTVFFNHNICLENIINRRYCRDFDQVYLINSDVSVEVEDSDFKPFDEWDEEF